MSKVIHINGIPGSGKTTLVKKLNKNKNILAIDTDDISDANEMKMLNNKKCDYLYNKKNIKKYFKLLEKENNKSIKQIIKDNKNKIIVFAGLSIVIPNPDYGFVVKTDIDTNFKRLNLRSLEEICNQKKEIKKLLQSNIPTYKKDLLLFAKLRLHVPFATIVPDIEKRIEKIVKIAKENKFKLLKSDDIYKQIINNIKID